MNRNFLSALGQQKKKSSESVKRDPFFSTLRVKIRLIKFFEQKTYLGRTKLLNSKIREKIMDKSDYIHHKIKKIFYYKLMDMMGNIIMKLIDCLRINRIPLFNPEQTWRIAFNSIIVIFNCLYLYVVSLKIAFNSPETNIWQQKLMDIAQVVWIADMLIQMNTAMYHHNEFTEDRKVIMKIFLKEYFFFEVLPIIFENLHSSNFYLNILFHLPLLLKIKEFYILQMLENHSGFLLSKLFMKMILFGHILACCRNSVISYEASIDSNKQIWSASSDYYQSDDQVINYLQNMFWAFSLMLNVQHPTPTTKIELIFTSCCMLISCIVFGYLLTSIGSILSQLNKDSEDYKKDLNILNQYMKRKKIEIGLKRRANISLKKYYDQQVRIKITEERATLDKVDNRMFRELQVSSNQRVVGFCPVLTHLFTQSTLEQLCVNFEEVFYSPHETILNNNEKHQTEYYLYIVIEGKIRVYENYNQDQVSNKESDNEEVQQNKENMQQSVGKHNSKNNHAEYGQIIEKGQYFGLMGFMLGRQLTSQAESLDYSTLLRISRSEVERIIQNNTKDREKFLELKDRLLYNNDISNLFIECAYCQSKSHLSQNCNFLHFNKVNPFLHMKNNFSQPQDRQKQNGRLKLKYMNALKLHKRIQDNIFELRSNYGIESSKQSIVESEAFLDESLNTDDQRISKDQMNIKDQSVAKDSSYVTSSNARDDNNKRDQSNIRDYQSTKEHSFIKVFRKGESNEENIFISQQQEDKNEQEKRILDESDESYNLMDDSDSQLKQNKNNNKQKKERYDKIKQAKSYKFKNDDQYQHQSKKKIGSINEIKMDDYLQQFSSQIVGNVFDASKHSQQSFHNIKMNETTVSSYQQLQPYQYQHQSSYQQQHQQPQFHLSRTRVKSLIEQRDEELLTYDLVEDDIVSRKNIQKLPSNLFQKGHGVYFHEGNLEKLQSQGSLFNIQRIPTLETILKKQNSHLSTHNVPQVSAKQKLYSSSIEKQATGVNQIQKNQNRKQSLKNSCSININTQSLTPAHSKDNRNYMGSKKEASSPYKGKTKQTVQSGSNNQSFLKLEGVVTNFQSISNIEDDIGQNYSDKQGNRQQQRQLNQDKKFYWNFDKLQNFQFYFFNFNSGNQIKKYNTYIQSKKNKQKIKTMANIKKEKVTNQP